MRVAFALIGLCALARVTAQPILQVDPIRQVQPWPEHSVYTFPHLRMPERPIVASRIHRQLCIAMLEIDPDTAGDRVFTNVWGDATSNGMARLNELTWSVKRPLDEVVEIEMSGETCGAYCEGFDTHYQFDLRNGERLSVDGLFTAQGKELLNDTLRALWTARLAGHITELERTILSQDQDPASVDAALEQVGLYRRCLEERVKDPYVADYMIEADGLRFFLARCASPAELALDELDPVSFTLPFAYCRALMRSERVALFP